MTPPDDIITNALRMAQSMPTSAITVEAAGALNAGDEWEAA